MKFHFAYRIMTKGAVALAALLLVIGVSNLSAAEPIKIGVVGGLSGFCGSTINPAVNGLKMAADEINRVGGVSGRPIQLLIRDSKSKPDEGAKQARDLIENEGVHLLTGPCSSSVWLAISPLAKENKIPLFSFAAASHRGTIDFGHPYIYQGQQNTIMDANAAAVYATQHGWKKVVTIGLDYEWGHSFVAMFVKRFKELNPDAVIAKQLWPKFGESNMASFITATLAEKPDVVFAATFGPTSTALFKQGNAYGLHKRTNMITIITLKELIAMGSEMPDGIHGISRAPFFALNTSKARAFVKNYRARYKKYPEDFAIIAYDLLHHFAEGLRRNGGTDPDKLRKTMASFTHYGVRGPIKFRFIDNTANTPDFIGVTKKSSKYPFSILANVQVIPGSETMPSEEQVMQMREAAKKK